MTQQWKTVPVEPTPEMTRAFASVFHVFSQKATFPEAVKAMLEAAPEQPTSDADIPDLIAGMLGVSRGTAYDLMREALLDAAPEQPDTSCKFPLCQTEEYQQMLADQVAKELVGVQPVAWLFQHDETGRTQCVDIQQVEWGFEKNNPRWKKIHPLFVTPPNTTALLQYAVDTIGYYASVCREDDQDTPAKQTINAIRKHLGE